MGGLGKNSKYNNIVFTPTKTNEVTEKLDKAYDLKTSATTITMKNENGKTMGMVRGLNQANKLTGSKLFDINSKFKKLAGIRLTQLNDYGLSMDKVFTDGKNVYILNDIKSDNMLNTAKVDKDSPIYADIQKRKKKSEFLTNFENNGGYVINYRKR